MIYNTSGQTISLSEDTRDTNHRKGGKCLPCPFVFIYSQTISMINILLDHIKNPFERYTMFKKTKTVGSR